MNTRFDIVLPPLLGPERQNYASTDVSHRCLLKKHLSSETKDFQSASWTSFGSPDAFFPCILGLEIFPHKYLNVVNHAIGTLRFRHAKLPHGASGRKKKGKLVRNT